MSKFTVSCVVAAASMMICAAAQAAGGMPSKIPHPIDAYKITDANNPCIMCHGDQSKMGAAKVKGQPMAMPADHWVKGEKKADAMHNNCTMCHANELAQTRPSTATSCQAHRARSAQTYCTP